MDPMALQTDVTRRRFPVEEDSRMAEAGIRTADDHVS
jgi:hypothetical protein